jgi:hypothetical protein
MVASEFDHDELLGVMRDGLSATKVTVAAFEGIITDHIEVADYTERRKMLELITIHSGRATKDDKNINLNMPITLVHNIPRPPRDANTKANG